MEINAFLKKIYAKTISPFLPHSQRTWALTSNLLHQLLMWLTSSKVWMFQCSVYEWTVGMGEMDGQTYRQLEGV